MSHRRRRLVILVPVLLLLSSSLFGQENALPELGATPQAAADTELSGPIQIALMLTVLAMAPAILMTVTSFTRIIVVLSFVRKALAIQDLPPNQVVVGMGIFLTVASMQPVLDQVWADGVKPYIDDEITLVQAAEKSSVHLHEFLRRHAQEDEVQLFLEITNSEQPDKPEDVSIAVMIPAFALSELKVAFKMGFLIYIPFLVVDIVVASILLSMGMVMLPPVIISTPFKILLFIMVDGWSLVIGSLMQSFQVAT
ncbi:MAG: flagellar type III secretion system pore protein FliP [Planctomycetes bacterium]|nr:flagellar type III secretion system pore protein FliP [Planctomycetota bacterium]